MFSEIRVEYLDWARRARAVRPRVMLLDSGTSTPLSRLEADPATFLADPLPDVFRQGTARAVAHRYDVPATEVFPVLGASLAVFLAAAAVLRPGERARVETPGYESLRRVSEALGARVDTFERRAGERWRLDPARVLDRWTSDTRLVLVSDLHNPTGCTAGDDALTEIAREVTRRNAWLLVDEVYRDFRPGPVGTARRLGGNVLIASSLTKVYGLGNLRLGWVLGPAAVIERLPGIQDVLHSLDPTPLESLATEAFRRADQFLEAGRARAARGRSALETWSRDVPELAVTLPDGGIHAWIGLPAGLTGTRVADHLLERHGVAVVPGRFFGDDTGIRAGFPEDPALLREGLDALRQTTRELMTPRPS